MPDNSFLVDGTEHNVPCVFQIWEQKETNRTVAEKIEPLYFEFVDKKENPDISFRRVGVNAGTMDVNIDEKNIEDYVDFSCNRVGHDVRYALDDSKLRSLGWIPAKVFGDEIVEIVNYYKDEFIW